MAPVHSEFLRPQHGLRHGNLQQNSKEDDTNLQAEDGVIRMFNWSARASVCANARRQVPQLEHDVTKHLGRVRTDLEQPQAKTEIASQVAARHNEHRS
jgi:hypothetical protein